MGARLGPCPRATLAPSVQSPEADDHTHSELSRSAPIPHSMEPSGEKDRRLTAPKSEVGRTHVCWGGKEGGKEREGRGA